MAAETSFFNDATFYPETRTMSEFARETHLASWYLPVTSNKPLSAIKVSLPQQRMKPVEKWGKPAANDVRVGIAAPDDGP